MSLVLEPDVAAALGRAGLRVRSFQDVTTIHSPTIRRSAYRIDLNSGETIKARCLEDEDTARRLFEIRRDLPDAFVPAFDRDGRVLLERWVQGEVLGDKRPSDSQLVEAGALLAGLHTTASVAGAPVHGHDSTAAWREQTERDLRTIVESGALDERGAERLSRALERSDPERAIVGLGHFDFCGENMVIDPGGWVRVFDNDRMGVFPIGFDLARAWYRWGLPAAAWEVFRGAYASRVALDEPLTTLDFWGIVALVQSARIRLRADPARVQIPMSILRRMAAGEPGGSTP